MLPFSRQKNDDLFLSAAQELKDTIVNILKDFSK